MPMEKELFPRRCCLFRQPDSAPSPTKAEFDQLCDRVRRVATAVMWGWRQPAEPLVDDGSGMCKVAQHVAPRTSSLASGRPKLDVQDHKGDQCRRRLKSQTDTRLWRRRPRTHSCSSRRTSSTAANVLVPQNYVVCEEVVQSTSEERVQNLTTEQPEHSVSLRTSKKSSKLRSTHRPPALAVSRINRCSGQCGTSTCSNLHSTVPSARKRGEAPAVTCTALCPVNVYVPLAPAVTNTSFASVCEYPGAIACRHPHSSRFSA